MCICLPVCLQNPLRNLSLHTTKLSTFIYICTYRVNLTLKNVIFQKFSLEKNLKSTFKYKGGTDREYGVRFINLCTIRSVAIISNDEITKTNRGVIYFF